MIKPINTPTPSSSNKYERKLYTGIVNMYALPYVNANNEELKEMGFYTRDEEPDYSYAKGTRLEVYLETREATVYGLEGNELEEPLDMKYRENFFISNEASWPKEKEDGLYTFCLLESGDVKWVKVKKKKDSYVLDDKKIQAEEGEYRLFTNFSQRRVFDFFYIVTGFFSHNISVKVENKKIMEENKKIESMNKISKKEPRELLPLKKYEQTYTENGETHSQSTSALQVFDLLFPTVDMETLKDLMKVVPESNGGVLVALGINHNNGKVYQTLHSDYGAIGNVPTPEYETRFAKSFKEAISKYSPKNSFFNTQNTYLMEWNGESNEDQVSSEGSDGFGDFSDAGTDLADLF